MLPLIPINVLKLEEFKEQLKSLHFVDPAKYSINSPPPLARQCTKMPVVQAFAESTLGKEGSSMIVAGFIVFGPFA